MCGGTIYSMSAVAFDTPRHIPPRLAWLLLNAGNYVLVATEGCPAGMQAKAQARHRQDTGSAQKDTLDHSRIKSRCADDVVKEA